MREVMYLRLTGSLTFGQIGEIMGKRISSSEGGSLTYSFSAYILSSQKLVRSKPSKGAEPTDARIFRLSSQLAFFMKFPPGLR